MRKLLTFAHLVPASSMLKHFGFWDCLVFALCYFLAVFEKFQDCPFVLMVWSVGVC